MNPIQIGSRKYGVYDDDSDYDYILLVPEPKVGDVLSTWYDKDITEMARPKRYRIVGTLEEGDPMVLPDVPVGGTYDITLIPKPEGVPDEKFIHDNWRIYWMIHSTDIDPAIKDQVLNRLRAIRGWAKRNKVYGGAYPDGLAYLIYTINTVRKGYPLSKALSRMYEKCLYFHRDLKYSHVGYVANASFMRIKDIITYADREYPYTYHIQADKLGDMLHATKYLLDSVRGNTYITNDGTIHSQRNIEKDILSWIRELRSYDIDAYIA